MKIFRSSIVRLIDSCCSRVCTAASCIAPTIKAFRLTPRSAAARSNKLFCSGSTRASIRPVAFFRNRLVPDLCAVLRIIPPTLNVRLLAVHVKRSYGRRPYSVACCNSCTRGSLICVNSRPRIIVLNGLRFKIRNHQPSEFLDMRPELETMQQASLDNLCRSGDSHAEIIACCGALSASGSTGLV
jgi:hypothetical protein